MRSERGNNSSKMVQKRTAARLGEEEEQLVRRRRRRTAIGDARERRSSLGVGTSSSDLEIRRRTAAAGELRNG